MLQNVIQSGRDKGASDVHIESGMPVVFRVRGELVRTNDVVSHETTLETARSLLTEAQWREFRELKSADFSKTVTGTRCRIHLFHTIRGIGIAVRLLSSFQNNISDCNLHPDFARLIRHETGLIILSGPTGSGKSTTLAAMIEEINRTRLDHIVTIESPVEYYFTSRKSIIRQREIPSHSPSFEQAITDSLREDPDVLVIGEMRTPEVMRLTLNAAETGHLVIATMHSSNTADALARICMSFPAEIQASIRAQLADCLISVVSQRLTYLPQQKIVVPLCEILMASTGAKANIRAGQFSQIISSIQTGGEDGMWSVERYQKWIDQKSNWMRPGQAAKLDDSAEIGSAGVNGAFIERPSPTSPKNPVALSKSSSAEKREIPSDRVAGERIEIVVPDEDLEEIAKKISDDE